MPPWKHVPFIPPSHPTQGSLFLSSASSPPLPLHLVKAHSAFGFQPLLTTTPSLLLGTLILCSQSLDILLHMHHVALFAILLPHKGSRTMKSGTMSPFLHHILSANAAAATHGTFVQSRRRLLSRKMRCPVKIFRFESLSFWSLLFLHFSSPSAPEIKTVCVKYSSISFW